MHEENSNRPEILFVDDSKTARKTAKNILSDKYVVHEAVNGKEAWDKLEKNPDFAVVFADLQMPELNGMQLLEHIRTSPDRRIAQKPVIMITGHSDSHAAMRAVFEMGATGFISKPFSDIDLLSCACSYISLNQKLSRLEDKLGIDRQSGLYNASRFEYEGNKALSLAMRHKLELSVVYIELKELSEISSNNSNKVATQVVVEVGKRIEKHLREEELVARVGASTFALLLPATNSYCSTIAIKRVQDMINNMTFVTKKNQIKVDIAAGISSIDLNNKQQAFNELCMMADATLKKAINSKGGSILTYCDEADLVAVAENKVHQNNALHESLPYIIDGEYQKVTDERLVHVISILKPFMQYASVKTGIF
jgi:diguanylate cyclase (GGDEF)-like protein